MNPEKFPFDFGDWVPDQEPLGNPGLIIAKNCIPADIGYLELKEPSEYTDNASLLPIVGSFWMQDDAGVVHNFCGDEDDLFKLSGATWTNVTRLSGGDYDASRWEFEKFGERVIAVNISDVPQYYDVGTSTDFAALPGTPPQASAIAVVRDFVVLGNLVESATSYPNRIRWSAFNNSEDWTADLATQSDFQDFFGRAGKVQRIVPGEVGVVFLEHGVQRMFYTGPPQIFTFDEVERGRGTPAPASVVWIGGYCFYYSQDGFQRMRIEGGPAEPIGHEIIDRWFLNEVASDDIVNMVGAVDRANSLIFWAFRTTSGTDEYDRVLIYNWKRGRWAYADRLDVQWLGEHVATGYSLDGLDTPLPNGIDTDSIPVESTAYQGGGIPTLQVFDNNGDAGTLSGDPLYATFETAEIGDRVRIHLNAVSPKVDGNDSTYLTLEVGTRNKLTDAVTYSSLLTVNDLGEFTTQGRGRYTRLRLNIRYGFDRALGAMGYGRQGARK